MNKAKIIFSKHAALAATVGNIIVPVSMYYGYHSKKKGDSAAAGFGKATLGGGVISGAAIAADPIARAAIADVVPKRFRAAALIGAGAIAGLGYGTYQALGRLFAKDRSLQQLLRERELQNG